MAISAAAVHMRIPMALSTQLLGEAVSVSTFSVLKHVQVRPNFVDPFVQLVCGWLVDVSWWIAQSISRQTCHVLRIRLYCNVTCGGVH